MAWRDQAAEEKIFAPHIRILIAGIEKSVVALTPIMLKRRRNGKQSRRWQMIGDSA